MAAQRLSSELSASAGGETEGSPTHCRGETEAQSHLVPPHHTLFTGTQPGPEAPENTALLQQCLLAGWGWGKKGKRASPPGPGKLPSLAV